MVDLRDEPEMPDHRIVEDLTEVVDRPDRDVRLAQPLDDLRLREPGDTGLEPGNERVAVVDAARVVGEARVLDQLLEVQRATESLEQRVVRAADVHEAVGRRNVWYGTIELWTFPSGRGTVPSAK